MIISRKRLKILLKQHNSNQPDFKVRLNNSHSQMNRKTRFCLFNVTILNLANSKNGIVPHLEIEYHTNDNIYEIKTLKLDYQVLSKPENKNDYTYLPIDIALAERETKTGWLYFTIPESLKNKRIHRYVLLFTDTTGHSESICSILLNQISDEN